MNDIAFSLKRSPSNVHFPRLSFDPPLFWTKCSPTSQSRLAFGAWRLVALTGTAGLCLAAVFVFRCIDALHTANHRIETADRLEASMLEARPSAHSSLVEELPLASDRDSLMRFAIKLAHEQDLKVVQMRSEELKGDGKRLVRTRTTLQLRGDYRSIKTLLIALLAKFPGLTLEHLALRAHPVSTPAASAEIGEHADDDATLELIQYSRPAWPSSFGVP